MSTDLHRVDTLNGVDSHEITLYEYDGRNLVTREVNALGDSTIYVYDGIGTVRKQRLSRFRLLQKAVRDTVLRLRSRTM